MRILVVTAEFAPLAKVGGLGDMVAALSTALAARGHDLRVVLPLYGGPAGQAQAVRPVPDCPRFRVPVGRKAHLMRLFETVAGPGGVRCYLPENEALFGRPGVYHGPDGEVFPDSLARAVCHARSALVVPELLRWQPQVIHCHDAWSALTLVYHRHRAEVPGEPPPARPLLPIHNLAHQEVHPHEQMALLGLPAAMGVYPGILEFHGRLNLLKAGILSADLINTVSPTYAREVVSGPELGYGLDGVLRQRAAAFSGLLNGADLTAWDPARDPHLPASYDASDLSGKQRCRKGLIAELGLAPGDGPLLGMVGRVVPQKGLDLLLAGLDKIVAVGFSLVVLGTGDQDLEAELAAAAKQHQGRVAFVPAFDEALAHRIFAGCDLFLMPSLFEPCGLTQLYALRYGAVPVVRHTGGLADTVTDAALIGGTGFVFHNFRPAALLKALARARAAWADREGWAELMRQGMESDFSWDGPARAYEDLFRRLVAAQSVP